MKHIFFIILFLSSIIVLPAQENCYQDFLNKGITAYHQLDFERALNQFEAAKICDDKPLSDTEINGWINRTQSGYIDAIKKAKAEAERLKTEAEALRAFVKGQEREFKGFLQEALDYFTEASNKLPQDVLFRERRAQLAMSDVLKAYLLAEEDLRFLIEKGDQSKVAEYKDDLAYVLEQMNNIDAAIAVQMDAASQADFEQAPIYDGKVKRLKDIKNKGRINSNISPSSPLNAKNSTVVFRNKEMQCNAKNVLINIDKSSIQFNGKTFDLNTLTPGTYQYEVSGMMSCPGKNPWPAVGKGTITIRPDSRYYMDWELTKYGKCEMEISNY